MPENEYIQIKKSDLHDALLAAFEAGWSGTMEVSESAVQTIAMALAKTVKPMTDESVMVKKMVNMAKNKPKPIGDDVIHMNDAQRVVYELGRTGYQRNYDNWATENP